MGRLDADQARLTPGRAPFAWLAALAALARDGSWPLTHTERRPRWAHPCRR